MEHIKWDGKEYAQTIATALIQYIDEGEREKARHISYGDLAHILKDHHGRSCHGGSVPVGFVVGDSKGVTVEIYDLHKEFEMTWNKAAKAIHEYIDGYEEEPDDDESIDIDDDDDDDDDGEEYDTTLTEGSYTEAVRVNAEIIAGAGMAQQGLYQMAQGFKKMRDGRLYKALGYKTFEEYCEKETGMTRRNVYHYISIVEKLPEDFVKSTSQIGSEKLRLLAKLDEGERKEVTKGTDLESVTVKELKARIDELTGAVEREKQLKEDWRKQCARDAEAANERAKESKAQYKALEKENNELLTERAELTKTLERVRQVKDEIAAEVKRQREIIEHGTELTEEQKAKLIEDSPAVAELRRQLEEAETAAEGEERRNEELLIRIHQLEGEEDVQQRMCEAEFTVKYKAAFEYVKLLCVFTASKGSEDMKRRVLTIADLITSTVKTEESA